MSKKPTARASHGRAWRAAEAAGIDMSLVESALRKTPAERLRAHDRALAAALALREAMEKHRAKA
ncbi:MAG: hypothetical protein HZA91_04570 [Verrucomicrobia bacterium]|nr:hypothetical protein [Verrucomicrobiota bacterium]